VVINLKEGLVDLNTIFAQSRTVWYSDSKYLAVEWNNGVIRYFEIISKTYEIYEEIEKEEMPGDIENKIIKNNL